MNFMCKSLPLGYKSDFILLKIVTQVQLYFQLLMSDEIINSKQSGLLKC